MTWIFIGLAIGGTFQSLLGFFQFVFHKSIGFYLLGESFLSPLNENLARVFVNGGRLLRAYGTFPHPNVLAAFLVLSLLSIYFLFDKKLFTPHLFSIASQNSLFTGSRKGAGLVLFSSLIFINWLGLILTFSRAGWIVGILASAIFLFLNFHKNLFFIILATLVILSSIFYWAIFPRVNLNYQNFSVQNRLGDYQLAWQKIIEKPWLGHGLIFSMGERPIHNLYLTIAVETGLVGLLVFIIFITYILIGTWDSGFGILRTMLTALLLFGLFDHFLWTLRPGLAMFWLVAGSLFTNHVWRKWHRSNI